jgi:DNA repair photolyase
METQDGMFQDEAAEEAYRYFMRVDPDMRDILGPITHIDDPVTGKSMRVRDGKISMMRGSDKMVEQTIYLDPIPHIRLDKGQDLRGWYSNKGDGAIKGKRERPCETNAVLTQPYGGYCAVGCRFCYINSGHRGYRGSGLATVPIGYGAMVAKQLATMKHAQAGYFSSFTDPFLSLEDYYHNTQSGAQAFVNAGLPIFFLSRLSYPGWAYDLMAVNPHSYMQKSINTPHEDDWAKLSPGAITLAQHFDEIREAHKRGIYVSIQCNPVIAGITTHDDIEQLIALLAEAGANHVIVKFVEANHPWRASMEDRITKAFGNNRAQAFIQLFTENQAGSQRTVEEPYRREAHTRYRAAATKAGMTYSLCYEYTHKTGAWTSMGPEFLTADQCHGHRVPTYIKRGETFTALDVCPPSGCLRCAETTGKAPCGSDLLASGKAFELRDMRQEVGA